MATFSALELKQDGDVTLVKIKHSSKPTLKDFQTYLKKKTLPAVLVSYPYGTKRITMIGYVKGKDTELSQHELPPPCEATEIYGSILLVCHSSKATWDTSASLIEPFLPADYEVFYEKACSGELEEDDEEKDDAVDDEDAEVVDDDDAEAVDDDVDIEAEDVIEEIEDDVEEEAPRVRVSRKVPKIDPAQLQFQFKSVLLRQDETNMEAILENPHRMKMFSTFHAILDDHCDESDIAELEKGVYNACIDEAKKRLVPLTWDHTTFKWVYTMIAKRTVSNLHPDSYVGNKSLIERWKEGEFTLDTIGHWTSYELQPANWKELKDQQFRRDKRILEGNLAMATDRFRCSRCNKKLCSYYELQTRSADEPMTIFISCLNCGKNWKQ